MVQLSWDLHVHPGPAPVPRWGLGADIQAAARRAGLKGFVWKAHDRHTARDCAELAEPTPRAVGSASLNAWARPDSLAAAIAEGARWVWGPTWIDGRIGWETPLPDAWPDFAAIVEKDTAPLVLATGHLGAEGRQAFAALSGRRPGLLCSITHSLYLDADEAAVLRDRGCVFEVDLYTATRAIEGRPVLDLARGVQALRGLGATVYLTTDCGQPAVGDPYVFSGQILAGLERDLGEETLAEIAVTNPHRVAAHALGGLQ
jgi:hypothetical protein